VYNAKSGTIHIDSHDPCRVGRNARRLRDATP
jgi:hypothetical protein